MKNIFLLSTFLFSTFAFAQTSNKKATNYYNKYSYSKVVDKLENEKNINTEAQRNLAESYKMTGNYSSAEASYAKVVAATDKKPQDVYAYAQVLKMNGKYSEAQQQMDAYTILNSADSRAKLVNQNKTYTIDLLKDKGQFTVKNLVVNSAEQDFGATYFKDQIVYTSSKHQVNGAYRRWNGNNLPFLDLYIGKEDVSAEIIGTKKLSSLNKKYHEGPSSYSKDGNIVMYTQDNYKAKSTDGVRKLEMYEAKMKDGKWGSKVAFPLNNKEYSCGHPALTTDGNTMYFSSDMPGGLGGVDIYKITRNTDGTWGKAENLGDKINTEGNEMFPFIHESGLFMFSSDGRPGLGGLDVFATEIKDNKINKIINLGAPINGSKDDFSFVLNADKTKGYFASNREGGKGDDDIYSFNLLKPLKFGKTIKGTAKDKEGVILANTAVNLYDPSGKVINTVTTTETGAYSFDVDDLGTYKLDGKKEKYFDGKNNASVIEETDVVVSDVILEKDPGNALRMVVTDGKSKEPLEGVKYKITDLKTGEIFMQDATPASGDAMKPLMDKKINDVLGYKIELVKDGYFPKTVNFNHTIAKPGIVNVHEALDLTMDKEVKDLRDLVVINDIRFDLNKFNIRPDAATELDKVVAVMNKYPGMQIELGSHTDCRASYKYNETLSDKRAKASAAYIKSKITNPARIYGKGYGEAILLNGCACEGIVKSTCSEEEHQKNRRTEFKILSMGADAGKVDVKNNSTNSFNKK